MQITKVDIFKADLPLKKPFRIALGETIVAQSVFIRVHTDADIHGMGEANPLSQVVSETQHSAIAAARYLARLIIGSDPLDIEARVEQMRSFMPGNPTIRSAFDMALYDILGKAAGLPLHRLLGGGCRTLVTDNTVGIDTPYTMARQAVAFQERGFSAIKVKIGTSVDADVERVRAIRAAVGPEIAIRVDANQGWDRISAQRALRELTVFDLQYCEQPVAAWDIEGLAAISAQSAIPIMADEALFDEHDAIRLVERRACQYFNVKLAKSSGLHVALKINAIAEAAGILSMVGCMTETRLGLTAAAHLVSARPNFVFADLDGADMLRDDPVTGGMVYGEGGRITLPVEPGLGADLEAGFLSTLEATEVTSAVH